MTNTVDLKFMLTILYFQHNCNIIIRERVTRVMGEELLHTENCEEYDGTLKRKTICVRDKRLGFL